MPRSVLHEAHEALGARFVDFGAWEMPLQYEGVLAEHAAVREAVGVFDVSHLGRFTMAGPGADDIVQRLLCNDITEIEPGQAQYTMFLNESGGVIDDIIVWRWADDDSWVLPNGANQDRVLAAFDEAASDEIVVEDRRSDTVLLAVQGPQAPALIEQVVGAAPNRFRVARAEYGGEPLWMAGTGYTGEKGGELAVPHSTAPDLLAALVDAGAVPCGLGARDSLRLEMGYPLWGQDLDEETTPMEAGLSWVVGWDSDFIGKEALVAQRDGGVSKRLVGFAVEGHGVPRHGYSIRAGESTGVVASGNHSPALSAGIGMGYMAPAPPADLEALEIEMRGEWVKAKVVDPPFI